MSTMYERQSKYPDLPRFEELERPAPAEDCGVAEACRARQMAMLGRLADMAMDLCEDAYLRAKAQGAAEADAAAEAAAPEPVTPAAAPAPAKAASAPAARIEDQIEALEGVLAGAGSAGRGAPGGLPPRADPSLVFSRLSWVVFRALALEKQLAEAADAEAEAADPQNPYFDPEMTPERKARIKARWALLLTRKNTVVGVMKAAVVAEQPDRNPEAFAITLNDTLLEFERFEVLNFTIWDNVLRLAERFGLHPRWEDWAHERWAIAEQDGVVEWNRYPGPGP